MATEQQRDHWRDAATRRKVRDLHRAHGLGHYAVSEPIGHGFGPVTLDPRSEYFVGCLRESANTAEITAMTQLMLWVKRYRAQHEFGGHDWKDTHAAAALS